MNINEAVSLASRIESLIRRADIFQKTREEVLDELGFISNDLREYADRLEEVLIKEHEREAA